VALSYRGSCASTQPNGSAGGPTWPGGGTIGSGFGERGRLGGLNSAASGAAASAGVVSGFGAFGNRALGVGTFGTIARIVPRVASPLLSMRSECASNATRTVLNALSKLAAPDLLSTGDLKASLLPSERCFLRNAGLHDAAGQLPSCNAADNDSRVISCWHMNWGDCGKRPLQAEREASSHRYGGERPWLPYYVSRYASLAAGAPESSHFAVAAHVAGLPAKSLLRGDGQLNGLRTLFVGDSLASQLQSAAVCELGRALSSRLHGRAPSAAATLIEMHDFRPNMTAHGNSTLRLASVDATAISRLHERLDHFAATGGTLVVGMWPGVYYTPPAGYADFGAYYLQQARPFLAALDGFAAACARCVALLVTPTAQHFATADGSYSATEASTTDALSSFTEDGIKLNVAAGSSSAGPCQPWFPSVGKPSVKGRMAAPGRKDQTDWQQPEALPEASPNVWRGESLLGEVKRSWPHLIPVPLHRLSTWWWHAHPSYRGGAHALDCTHWCWLPFLWESVWWALRVAEEAARDCWETK
jgi:hypothetical protein